ncbi:toll/interleukin-1 receptor domain-containing protein [Cytophaga aurantiaca]|uniref:toll/interleukin-1 receptor domain-containing protein n=1 Tax=Cytophaga aurantiaca TaxID=29530 RepID=UPI000373918A|nr:toll/interleukin-1 receptor domain-containing protein [Cytophaga aurantiaca]
MLDQENIYQLIFKEQWTDILDLLYTDKKDISNDTLLQQAAMIFEQEFFKKVSDYPIEQKEIEDNLDTLYILSHGKFYLLANHNYRTLIIELVKRKPLTEAINYARHFPDEEICKATINKFEQLKIKDEDLKLQRPTNITMNWIEIYNRLFELINIQGDTATYYSGPRFINTVREFEPYFPDYTQFIELRNQEGKSTSRKIFYYDILLEMKEEMRLKIVNRILEILKPHKPDQVEKIEELLGKPIIRKEVIENSEVKKGKSGNPIVFISYSWDDEQHKEWVLNLANRLCSDGIDVILDRFYLKAGKNLPHFVEQSIEKSERIIIVFTPNYKLKADKRVGGVGYEYSIMNSDLYNNQTDNEKVIPVLRAGSQEESIPTFMQQFIHIDTRNNVNFENSYVDLLREIYNEPAIQKPKLGAKPTFERKTTEEIEKPLLGERPNFKKEITGYINPDIVAKLKFNDTPILTLTDGSSINAGTIRIEENHLVHYTRKGIMEIFKPDMTEEEKKISTELQSKSEEYLTENNYITWTPLDTIIGINR